jgi:hypothetical protein
MEYSNRILHKMHIQVAIEDSVGKATKMIRFLLSHCQMEILIIFFLRKQTKNKNFM